MIEIAKNILLLSDRDSSYEFEELPLHLNVKTHCPQSRDRVEGTLYTLGRLQIGLSGFLVLLIGYLKLKEGNFFKMLLD